MNIKTTRSAIGKASMMALLMAVVALWATVAIAGMNEELIKAAGRGDPPEVKRLLAKGADVKAKDNFGNTALMDASVNGHREVVEALLAKGADVNAKNKSGFTALYMASREGHTEVVKALLAKGADPNVKITVALGPRNITTTALAEAVVKGKREIVKALLDHGAEVNLKTESDQRLLMFASKMGYREIEQMLKKAGAK